MKRFFIASLATLAIPIGLAEAAGPYDGKWSGSAFASANTAACSASLTVEVKDNKLRGTEMFGGRAAIPLSGTVAADGSFKSSGGGFVGKFSEKSFDGTFVDRPGADCHNWRATMERVGP